MCICKHGLWQSHHLAIAGIWLQDVCANGTDVFCQAHHQFLADGVDGWVGHLGELLTEIVEERLWTIADDSQWGVVSHRRHRFLSCCSHRHNGAVDVLLAETEVHQLAFKMAHTVLHMATALQLLQLHTVLVQPLLVGMRLGQLFLDLAIIIDLSFLCVDEQDLARLQATFADHIAWLEVHHTHFRCHHHHTLFGNGIATGAQTISVEHTTSIASI